MKNTIRNLCLWFDTPTPVNSETKTQLVIVLVVFSVAVGLLMAGFCAFEH